MPAPVTLPKSIAKPPQGARPTPRPVATSPASKPKAVIDGINVWSLYDQLMTVEELRGRIHPNNDNDHDDVQTLFLSNVFRGHGIRRSITLSRLTGRIVAGHGALKAAPQAGMKSFPVMWQDFKSVEEELAHLMADNEIARLAMRNEANTAANLDLLSQAGYDLTLTGIVETERMDLLSLLGGDLGDAGEPKKGKGKDGAAEVDDIEEVSDELPGAQALKSDILFMPPKYQTAAYDIPCLRLDMCMPVPLPFDSWAGPDGSPPQEGVHYLYNITSVMRELPIARSIFGFYADDHRFEVVWNQPDKYAAKLINAGFMGAVTPNFSLFFGAPMITHLWNIYKSRWVGRYFQEAGIKIIPDVPASGLKSLEYSMQGIPVGLPAICLQCQTSEKNAAEIAIRRAVYQKIEAHLKPGQIIVYGGDHTEEYLDGCFSQQTQVIHILNRMQKRRKVIAKNATFKAKVDTAG